MVPEVSVDPLFPEHHEKRGEGNYKADIGESRKGHVFTYFLV